MCDMKIGKFSHLQEQITFVIANCQIKFARVQGALLLAVKFS